MLFKDFLNKKQFKNYVNHSLKGRYKIKRFVSFNKQHIIFEVVAIDKNETHFWLPTLLKLQSFYITKKTATLYFDYKDAKSMAMDYNFLLRYGKIIAK